MNNYQLIIDKLEQFYRKFYVNELLRGAILFFAIGFLYFLFTVSLEYFLWLGKTARLIIFWLFIIVEAGLFLRLIVYPLLKLFKISKGIEYEEAAGMIGRHFPEVGDKLINVLQLKRVGEQHNSELLTASIDQKAEELQPVPFQFAINYKKSLPYLKYAAIPIFILLLIGLSGNFTMFSESYSRVVNYQQAYEPPAPFSFHILNSDLQSEENKEFKLKVSTQGKIIPQDVKIHYNGESYLLKNEKPGEFSYVFDRPNNNIEFHLSANKVRSLPYELSVIKIPKLLDFNLFLNYPSYLGKTNETIKGTGNITVPEGTEINWNLKTEFTDEVKLELADSILNFKKDKDGFSLKEVFSKNSTYHISTSNKDLKDFERLSYHIKVIPDQFPDIEVDMKKDTLDNETLYFHGRVSDDYGLTRAEMVFYPVKDPQTIKRKRIDLNVGNFDEFLYVFPDTLEVNPGESYEIYFQVFDNDGFNGSKKSKSEVFTYRKFDEDERENMNLDSQKESIQGLQKSLEQLKSSEEAFQELDRMQKENEHLNYNERKKVENYMNQIEKDNEMMKHFTEKMKSDLDDFQKDKVDEEKQALQERLERNEERLKENEKLLEELQKYRDKIGQEEMGKKLEELAKNKKAQNRNLEELLELTKRYYVQKKAERIQQDLMNLAEEQEKLSNKNDENTSANQERLNEKFEKIEKALEDLQEENLKLRKPMDLGRDEAKERSVKKDQQEATEQLEESEEDSSGKMEDEKKELKNQAEKNQKSAAEKMRQLSKGMQMKMQMGSQEQTEEDVAALRQILDNLIIFSFEQEDLMLEFQVMQNESPNFGSRLKYQQNLKENFKHVDDSLYALALRNPIISDHITTKLIDIDFNIDKALEDLAKFRIRNGTMNQQYVLTGANDLANMLDNALQNMQMMMMQAEGSGDGEGMPMPGSGGGEGKFQLPDIIQGQEELNQSMEEGMEQGQGEEGEDGDEGDQGDGDSGEGDGSEGEKGTESGEGGNEGNEFGEGQMSGEEMNSAKLYEIYKQQQKLRFQLQDLIERENLDAEALQLLKDMEQVEMELLEQGFSEKSLELMNRIKERMIRLQDASYQQEQEERRQAETNFENYKNTRIENLEKAKEYFQTIEILNRQSLPLQPVFKQKVQDYFNYRDDRIYQ